MFCTNEENVLKLHSNCKHVLCRFTDDPCKSCHGNDSKPNWELKEAKQPEPHRLPKVGDWVRVDRCKKEEYSTGGIVEGGIYQVIALTNILDPEGSGPVYVRSPEASDYDAICTNTQISQPFSFLIKEAYTLLPDYQPA